MSAKSKRPARTLVLRILRLATAYRFVELPRETVLYSGKVAALRGLLKSWNIQLCRGLKGGEEIGHCTMTRERLPFTYRANVFDAAGREIMVAGERPSSRIDQWPPIEIRKLAPGWSIEPRRRGEVLLLAISRGRLRAADVVEQYSIPWKTLRLPGGHKLPLGGRAIHCRIDVHREELMDIVALFCLGLVGAFNPPSSPA